MGYTVQRTSTLDFAPGERAEFWTEHVRGNHCLLDCRFLAHHDFHGGTVRQRGTRFQLVEFWSEGIAYLRSPRQIARDPDEDVRLLVPLRGTLAVRLGDGDVLLGPGEAGLLAMASPFELRHADEARALILTLPRTEVPARVRSRIDLNDGLGAILGAQVTGLARQRDRLDARDFDAVCAQTAELLGLVAAAVPGSRPGSLGLVERAFREHVAAHADDPALTGESAAAALGWSLRQVQVALRHAGTTPREVIREERLGRAYRRLSAPELCHLGTAEIAFTSGFVSVSTFGEVFRRRYGTAPRDVRPGRSR